MYLLKFSSKRGGESKNLVGDEISFEGFAKSIDAVGNLISHQQHGHHAQHVQQNDMQGPQRTHVSEPEQISSIRKPKWSKTEREKSKQYLVSPTSSSFRSFVESTKFSY